MSICKQCGATVIWKKLPNQQGLFVWHCFNLDGTTIHWDSCSKRRWQQVKATGERFEEERRIEHPVALVSGYDGSVHGTKLDRIAVKSVRGKHYHPTGQCRDCVPAWEPCLGCPDAFEATL